jgi:hypothetical protein
VSFGQFFEPTAPQSSPLLPEVEELEQPPTTRSARAEALRTSLRKFI